MSVRHMLVYWVCSNYRARATLVPWTTEKLVWAAVADSHDHTACALLFTSFSAQFLVHYLSNGGDRRLRVRVITAAAVRLWCLLVCLLVTTSLWRVDCVTSRPGDELTCDELTVWRVDRVMSWPCHELTGSLTGHRIWPVYQWHKVLQVDITEWTNDATIDHVSAPVYTTTNQVLS